MRFHDILGVRENATLSDVENAYNTKMIALSGQCEILPEAAYDKKREELDKAKGDCLVWISTPNSEKAKKRFAEGAKSWASPNRVNGVQIGCCTVCDYVCGSGSGCEDDSCCIGCCGSQTIPIACDVIGYVIIGIYALIGLFRFGKWISDGNREARYDNAVREQPELQRKLAESADWVREVTFAQSVKEKRERDLNLFANFFESMGVNATEELRIQEHERVMAHSSEISAAQREHDRLQKRIDSNNKTIQKGRN